MEIEIWVTDPTNEDAQRTLRKALERDTYLKEMAELEHHGSSRDGQGAELAVLHLAINAGFDLGKLALAFADWRLRAREAAARIAVRANGRTTELGPEDLRDPEDTTYVVRRALAGAPDPRRSACVLIGVSTYRFLRPLPAVRTNLVRLREALIDVEIWGVPPERVYTVVDPESEGTVENAVLAAAEDGPDTLLVYFAGHGLHIGEAGLHLALPGATGEDERDTLVWRRLAHVLRGVNVGRRIAWLDCCFAGLAAADAAGPDDEAEDGRSPSLIGAAEEAGTVLFAAASRCEEARVTNGDVDALRSGDGCTAFTGEIVKVLHGGIPPGAPVNEFFGLTELCHQVQAGLEGGNLPVPQLHDLNGIGARPHFHNTATRTRVPPPPPPAPSPRRGLRAVLAGGVAAVLVLGGAFLARGVGWSGTSPSTPVSGLSLTKYCSALGPERTEGTAGFVVAGTDCAERVDLDKACVFQYKEPGLAARFTSSDANSAVCLNRDTGLTYSAGISDMNGYCATRTTIPDVTATPESPGYPNTWVCRVPINVNLACDAQNNRNDLEARLENGVWRCYEN